MHDNDTKIAAQGSLPGTEKRPYHAPTLHCYGSLSSLTETTTHLGGVVDGAPTNHKTH